MNPPMKPLACRRWLLTLLVAAVFCPHLHAGWGSLRANNRSSAPAPRAPMQENRQVQVRPAQPVARPEPGRPSQPVPAQSPRPPARVAAPVLEQARADQADRQRLDIAEERRQSAFWSNYRPGMRMDRLPDGWSRIGVRGHDYFYCQGVFYDTGPSGYVVIAPPLDAEIPALPPDAESVVVGSTVYYYVAGAFYLQQPDGGFIVVSAPIGAVVSLLPPDASPLVVNGTTYYQADGVFYLPILQNGVTAYLTVSQP